MKTRKKRMIEKNKLISFPGWRKAFFFGGGGGGGYSSNGMISIRDISVAREEEEWLGETSSTSFQASQGISDTFHVLHIPFSTPVFLLSPTPFS